MKFIKFPSLCTLVFPQFLTLKQTKQRKKWLALVLFLFKESISSMFKMCAFFVQNLVPKLQSCVLDLKFFGTKISAQNEVAPYFRECQI